jgi:hypothetical protein
MRIYIFLLFGGALVLLVLGGADGGAERVDGGDEVFRRE